MTKINPEIAKLSKMMALYAVRNTYLENIHSGKVPFSKTGDGSDIVITDANGYEIVWNEASHISDEQMEVLMKEVVSKIYDVFANMHDEQFQKNVLDYAYQSSVNWDDPYPIDHSKKF